MADAASVGLDAGSIRHGQTLIGAPILTFVDRTIDFHCGDRSAHTFLTSKNIHHDSALLADEPLSTNGEPDMANSQMSDADRIVIDLGDDRESRTQTAAGGGGNGY